MLAKIVAELGPWSWWVAGLVLLAAEMIVPGFFLVWIGDPFCASRRCHDLRRPPADAAQRHNRRALPQSARRQPRRPHSDAARTDP
jgi:hypothetical protein